MVPYIAPSVYIVRTMLFKFDFVCFQDLWPTRDVLRSEMDIGVPEP